METFNFPMHLVSTKYPANGQSISFGGAYTFTSEPDAPDNRQFTLTFAGMKYFTASGAVDYATNAAINNVGALEQFYQRNGRWKSFTYPHPVYGDVVCKFLNPLDLPKGTPGGDGALPNFDVVMVEQP